ncbi:MAG: hypothetical protein SGILL_001762 [Bacillariaceae sp.]
MFPVMMMPPHVRATFVPNPPLKFLPPIKNRSNKKITGVFSFLDKLEKTPPPERVVNKVPKELKAAAMKEKKRQHEEKLQPLIEEYRKAQQKCGGEYQGMNCYNTLFVGRLAYEVTERKLLREMEAFGPVKDIKLVVNKDGKSRGFGYVEYENEEDMKRAYRAANGMRIEGRFIVVDVERGHTVPAFLPRRLGGGLGGTRLGGKDKNVFTPGRYDPSRPDERPQGPPPMMMMDGGGPPMGMGRGRGGGGGGGGHYGGGGGDRGGYGDRGGDRYGGPPPRGNYGPYGDRGGGYGDRGGGGDRYGGGGGGDRRRPRSRSRSPDHGRYAPRRRY